MVPKNIFTAAICATLLAWSGPSVADQYRPGDFLSLDLSKAVLSPKPLGPPTQFAPFPIEADTRRRERPRRRAPSRSRSRSPCRPRPARRAIHERTWRSRSGAARTRLAHRHGNPLDAEAFDRRIQVWPCKSGGICNWRGSANDRAAFSNARLDLDLSRRAGYQSRCLLRSPNEAPIDAASPASPPAASSLQEPSWNICKPRASACRGSGSAPFACRATSAARRSKARWRSATGTSTPRKCTATRTPSARDRRLRRRAQGSARHHQGLE